MVKGHMFEKSTQNLLNKKSCHFLIWVIFFDLFCIQSSQERSRSASLVEEIGRKPSTSIIVGDLQTEVFDSKKCGSKRFSWCKMGLNWKSCDQYECVVCLEKFKVGDKLTRLPCAHRFHFKCMVPWLENRTICPCCRMSVFG
ncbi:Zinc finger, RING/FYVE/PHD-type [Artemisia annua]|uniref:Zinc finger, RING/FYVE/PHD-type n=1 Tax=Artemisia annua TaxID=35608 RepID=A0A2U1PR73_ARTAN|nr:Zinc finger, RING/FYVE/PHD-type [Artemisia annua]